MRVPTGYRLIYKDLSPKMRALLIMTFLISGVLTSFLIVYLVCVWIGATTP